MSGQTMAKQGQTRNRALEGLDAITGALGATPRGRQGPAAGASVESAVLRRSRHANRRRRHLVLHGNADRAAGAGAAVFDHPQARGRQALSRDPGGEGRHPRRRCAVPRGRDAEGERRPTAACCASAPMSTTGWPAMPRTGCGSRPAADGGLTPYLHVRADLWAKVTRALYYDLVDIGEERVVDGRADVRGRVGGRILSRWRDAEQVRERALNEPMLKHRARRDQFGGVFRPRPRAAALRRSAGADRCQHRAARAAIAAPTGCWRSSRANSRSARGGADPGGRSCRSRPCC